MRDAPSRSVQNPTKLMKNLHYFSVLVVVLSAFIFAQAQSPGLSAPAQKAFDAGIAAAKAGDYSAAIRSLDEARKAAPDAPAIYFNLGLAESKIPGREARAICALEAYLALTPGAANSQAVRELIDKLEVTSRANVDKMIEILKAGFASLNTSPTYLTQPETSFPVLYLKLGRVGDAEALIKNPPRPKAYPDSADYAYLALAKTLVTLGRLDEAKKYADLVGGNKKEDRDSFMARAYIDAGRFREAKSILASYVYQDPDLLLELAVAEQKAGLADDAEARFQDAKLASEAQAKRYDGDQYWVLVEIPDLAYARWRMGQKDSAESLLKRTVSEAEAYSGKSPNSTRVHVLLNLAGTYELMDRHADALKIMDKVEKAYRAQISNGEASVGITTGHDRIYNEYRWLREWKRAESFINSVGVNKIFESGSEGLRKWIADGRAEQEKGALRLAAFKSINHTSSDPSATSAQKAAAWMAYSDTFLQSPIFVTDFNVMIKNLVEYTPPADEYDKPRAVFARVEEPAEAIVDALNNIHAMREKRPIITDWPT